MDSEILEQLKNIGQQLEKITKLLEEKKSFSKPSFGDRKPFGDRKSFGDRKPFGRREDRDFGPKKSRFGVDGKPRFIADGRDSSFAGKKRRPF